MPYTYELAMSANLSLQVVEEMIKDAVEKQTGKKIASMTAKYDDSKLNGYDVFFVTNTVKDIHTKTGKEFVVMDYDN